MSFIPEALQKHLNIYVEQNSIGIINSFTNHVWSKCICPQAYVTDRQTEILTNIEFTELGKFVLPTVTY